VEGMQQRLFEKGGGHFGLDPAHNAYTMLPR